MFPSNRFVRKPVTKPVSSHSIPLKTSLAPYRKMYDGVPREGHPEHPRREENVARDEHHVLPQQPHQVPHSQQLQRPHRHPVQRENHRQDRLAVAKVVLETSSRVTSGVKVEPVWFCGRNSRGQGRLEAGGFSPVVKLSPTCVIYASPIT